MYSLLAMTHVVQSSDIKTVPKTAARRVAVLIESSSSWGAGLLKGIAYYIRHQAVTPWTCYWQPWGKNERILMPDGIQLDGVIARVSHEELASQIVGRRIPAVNCSWYHFPKFPIPQCTSDEAAAGNMIAEYFLSLGYRSFAYCPANDRGDHADRFGESFVSALANAGHTCERYIRKPRTGRSDWFEQVRDLATWLERLEKPVAILAFHDVQARIVAEACKSVGLRIPQEIAIMGGEQDEISAALSSPPLTSIDLAPEEIGREAARILEGMMMGAKPPGGPVLTPPARVVPRQSTDSWAIEDKIISEALKFIEDNLSKPINVNSVVRATSVSRRNLEQRFKRFLGRTVAGEVRNARTKKAARLLSDTNKSIMSIALECGFYHSESLTRAFQREFHKTPTEFRKQSKLH